MLNYGKKCKKQFQLKDTNIESLKDTENNDFVEKLWPGNFI